MCQCQKCDSQRKTFYDSLKDASIFSSIDPTKTFFDLMTNDNINVIKAVDKYIQECSVVKVPSWCLFVYSKPFVLDLLHQIKADTIDVVIIHMREYVCVCECVLLYL